MQPNLILLISALIYVGSLDAQKSKIDSTIAILKPIFAPVPIDKGFEEVAKFVDGCCELDSTTDHGQPVYRVRDIAPFAFTIPGYQVQQVKIVISRSYIYDSATKTTDTSFGCSIRLYAGKTKHKKEVRKFFKSLVRQLDPILFQLYNYGSPSGHFVNAITFQPTPSPSYFIFKGVHSIGRIKDEQVVYLHFHLRKNYSYINRVYKVLGYSIE